MLKILTFSLAYPNAEQPAYALFVERRLCSILAAGNVEAHVLAPVPWFPSTHTMFGKHGMFARVEAHELRYGISIMHPRYPQFLTPGWRLTPLLVYAAMKPIIKRIIEDGYDFDLLDAQWLFPTGIAAVMLGRAFDKPVVVTARGFDVNLMPKYLLPRKMIQRSMKEAAGIITVSRDLKEILINLGAPAGRIRVLRNGVQLDQFKPIERATARAGLSVTGRVLISVGSLIDLKGHQLTIEALAKMPEVTLLLIGTGPKKTYLRQLAKDLGVGNRVRFEGCLEPQQLPKYYSAADAMVLASSSEGMANVLLESLACGTPVIATPIPSNIEVIATPESGVIMETRSPDALVNAVQALFANYPNREHTRKYAEQFSWQKTAADQLQFFEEIVTRHNS